MNGSGKRKRPAIKAATTATKTRAQAALQETAFFRGAVALSTCAPEAKYSCPPGQERRGGVFVVVEAEVK
jgi:hypothetical protein